MKQVFRISDQLVKSSQNFFPVELKVVVQEGDDCSTNCFSVGETDFVQTQVNDPNIDFVARRLKSIKQIREEP